MTDQIKNCDHFGEFIMQKDNGEPYCAGCGQTLSLGQIHMMAQKTLAWLNDEKVILGDAN